MSNPSVNPDPYSTASSPTFPADPSTTGGYPAAPYPPAEQSGLTGQAGSFSTGSTNETSTTDVAKSEAAGVKDAAVEAGKGVVETAKTEAANVASEAKQQAKSLLGTATAELRTQAGSQQERAASALHALAKELGGMASASPESGPLTDLAHQASRKGGEIAHWLESHEPSDVLREVSSFARRRPVMFLALCGAAGVLAGRVTRGAVAVNTSVDSSNSAGARSLPAGPVAQPPVDYQAPGYGTFPGAMPADQSAPGYGGPGAASTAPSASTYGASMGVASSYEGAGTDPYRSGSASDSGWTDGNR